MKPLKLWDSQKAGINLKKQYNPRLKATAISLPAILGFSGLSFRVLFLVQRSRVMKDFF